MEKQSYLKRCFDIGFSPANFTMYLKIFCQYFLKASWYSALKKTLLFTKRYKNAISKTCPMLSNYQHLHLKHLRTAKDDSYSPNHQVCKPAFLYLFVLNRFRVSWYKLLHLEMRSFFIHRQQFNFQLRSLKSLCHVYSRHEKVWIWEVYHYLWTSWIWKAALEIITTLW